MNPKITALILGILILIGVSTIRLYDRQHQPATAINDSSQSATVDDETIRSLVTAFGNMLKSTSLIAPDASQQIARQYGPFVTPELLAKWQTDPTRAPGRLTSSPWPKRIDIASTTIQGNNASVEGTVIEKTSADAASQFTATYPVAIELEKRNGQWLITSFTNK